MEPKEMKPPMEGMCMPPMMQQMVGGMQEFDLRASACSGTHIAS
ncbi:MAG: hypothetical protein ACM335_00980 [Deltaproteobacteria bacterium]